MSDIAKRLGVSQASVSLAFRGKNGVSDELREKIFRTATELGYVIDESASSLRSQTATSIGVTFRTHQPFHDEVIDALYRAIEGSGNNLILSAVSDSRGEDVAFADLVSRRCGAIIALGSTASEEEIGEMAHGLPVVLVARKSFTGAHDWVMSDEHSAMDQIVSHLKSLGHESICFFSAKNEAGGKQRLEAFMASVAEHDIGVSMELPAGITERDGATAAERWLGMADRPTAIIGSNDRCALGALEVFTRKGLRIPEGVSLVGIDDSEIASRPSTDLTSVKQDVDGLARFAIARAAQRINKSVNSWDPLGVLVPTKLVVRSSTAPVSN